MQDLYKRLALSPTASEEEIRRALPAVDAATRAAVQFILLVPRRRSIYNRNHRVLCTIGQLRGRLALGLRPFWSHGHHQDFAQPFVAAQRTDPMSVIDAAGHREFHRSKPELWLWIMSAIVLAVVSIWIWRLGR
jgi:hypothetical protein